MKLRRITASDLSGMAYCEAEAVFNKIGAPGVRPAATEVAAKAGIRRHDARLQVIVEAERGASPSLLGLWLRRLFGWLLGRRHE